MKRAEYKMQHYKNHYERIHLAVPIGVKQVIQSLAEDKGLSVNAYLLELVRKDQEGMFDTMQLSEYNRNRILTIKGNTHDGYTVYLKDGTSFHCRTKLQIRRLMTNENKCLAQDSESLAQDT